jgi:hypothetical protein
MRLIRKIGAKLAELHQHHDDAGAIQQASSVARHRGTKPAQRL